MGSWVARLGKFIMALFIGLFLLSFLFMILTNTGYSPSTPYSITSKSDEGLSDFKKILEDNGFETRLIVSDPESVLDLKQRVVYTIIAPTLSYDQPATLTLLTLLQNGSSLLIVDDFGRANTLLWNIWDMISASGVGEMLGVHLGVSVKSLYIYFNTSAVVLDAQNYWKNPAYVVIRNFNDYHNILHGEVSEILTEFPAAISIRLTIEYENKTTKTITTALPYNTSISFMVTSKYSWLETDINSIMDGKAMPDSNEWGGVPFTIGVIFESIQGGRIAIIGDPDIFTNKVLREAREGGFDNEKFIVRLFEWLSEPTGSRIIVFDESRKAITPDNPLFGISLTMKVITSFVRYWVIAPILPILFILFFIYYLPRRFRTRILIFKPSVKKVGTSPYYGRYLWYMYRGGYREAFRVIMDNLRRTIKFRLGIPREKWEDIIGELMNRRPDLAQEIERLRELVEIWTLIVRGKKVKLKPQDYIEIFDFIKKFQSKL